MSKVVSLAVRVPEAVFAVICLGLSGSFIEQTNGNNGRVVYTVVVSALTVVYLVPVSILDVLNLIPFMVVYVLELMFFILWLIAFSLIANEFGNEPTCTLDGVTYHWCQEAKALIAFTFLLWLLFVISMILTAIFSVVPLIQSTSFQEVVSLTSNNFEWGGIFLKSESNEPNDPESEIGKEIEDSLDENNQLTLEAVQPLDVEHDIASSNVDML